jgi:glutamate dehydrogenase
MQSLEQRGLLDRSVEYLPDDAALAERSRRGSALTRPELAVLLAYAKLTLHDDLLATSVPDDPYLARELVRYFPTAIQEQYPDAIDHHRLRREIIATILSNSIINRGGPTAVVRLMDETGADVSTIALAFAAVRDVFSTTTLNTSIDSLDSKIDGQLQLRLYASVQDLLLSRVVWFIRNVDLTKGLEATVSRFHTGVGEIALGLDNMLSGEMQAARAQRRQALVDGGVPADLASRFADLETIVVAPDVVLVAEKAGRSINETAATWFAAEAVFRLDHIAVAARAVPANDYFERLAIDRAIEQIAAAERRLVADVLATGLSGDAAAQAWIEAHPEAARIRRSVEEIAGSGLTLAKITVAANLLGDLVKG